MTEPNTDTAPRTIAAHFWRHSSVPAQLAERMSCFDPGSSHGRDRWSAVWSIALGSFALVFSEVIPVGLLPDVSRDFGVSIGLAGLTVVERTDTPSTLARRCKS
jgi:hypothetical protein